MHKPLSIMFVNFFKLSIAIVLAVLYTTSMILAAPIIIPIGIVLCYALEGNLNEILKLFKELYVEYMVYAITLKVYDELC